MNRIKVYIASPYTLGDVAVNVNRQVVTADRLMTLGYAPYAPLPATHFQHVLFPRPYEDWIEFDKTWVLACDVVLRLAGESKGADGEVELAHKRGIPVVYSIEELLKVQPHTQERGTRGMGAAVETLRGMGYTYEGGERWKPPLGKPPLGWEWEPSGPTPHPPGRIEPPKFSWRWSNSGYMVSRNGVDLTGDDLMAILK